jgi:hypothetical protein
MTIDTAEDDVLGFVHRLDALMTLQTTDAFDVGFGLCLIDPIARRQCRACGHRSFDGDGGRRTIAGGGKFLAESNRGKKKQRKQTSNAQRPTLNAQ